MLCPAAKTTGVLDVLRKALASYERAIHLAFVFGQFEGHKPYSEAELGSISPESPSERGYTMKEIAD